MVDFIGQGVEDIRRGPESDVSEEFILKVKESHLDEVLGTLRDIGIEEVETGPFNTLLVKTQADSIDPICKLEAVQSIELNSTGTVLSQGN